jgi:cytochrome c biogenesis protein CcmG/thiol:disulfide interchange protein DsbE
MLMPEPSAVKDALPTSAEAMSAGRRSSSLQRRLVVVIGGIAILAVAFGIVWLQSAKYEPLTVGMQAPDFSLPDLEDTTRRLSDYHGKVVFLNFWATWCKPCKEEMPSMQVMWENLKSEDFVMLAVSMDRVTTKKDIRPFVENMRLTFPILTDAWGQTDKRYKLMGVPETYIIDQRGILREKVIGTRDWTLQQSSASVIQLLQKQPKSVKAL